MGGRYSGGVATEEIIDGRRARRDRNRLAVIDALVTLLQEGARPSTEEIAARAGVSVSSLFRYFDSIDDLQRQMIDLHFERFGPLFELPAIGSGARDERIARFVDARLELHNAVAPAARLARARAFDQPVIADTLTRTRRMLAAQIREHFAQELDAATPAVASDAVDAIDGLTSFETWDLMTTSHGRSTRQVRRNWVRAIASVLDGAS